MGFAHRGRGPSSKERSLPSSGRLFLSGSLIFLCAVPVGAAANAMGRRWLLYSALVSAALGIAVFIAGVALEAAELVRLVIREYRRRLMSRAGSPVSDSQQGEAERDSNQ